MKNLDRIPVIDFLRGLSCLGVLLYHVRVDLWIGWWRITSYPQEYSSFAKAMAWLSIPTPFMGYAVVLFFLISGFCIHYPNTIGNARPCWKAYLIRRFWRIYPAYFAALLFTASISYLCLTLWGDKNWDVSKIFRAATLTQNYPPGNGQFLSNPSLWTIPLEMEFYLLYPLTFLLFSSGRSSLLWLSAFAISTLCIFLSYQGYQWLTFTALFLWPSWLLGAWIAELYRSQKLARIKLKYLLPFLGFTVVTALISRYQNWETWTQYFAWTAFYSCFFIFSLSHTGILQRAIGIRFTKAVSWIGEISFSLYLIHFPLFKLLGYLHLESFAEKPANFLVSLLYLIPVIFLAWLFFKYVENPIHKWSKTQKVSL
jgi:peptidoglycan/LPS O-acetylase OafA/YrhL